MRYSVDEKVLNNLLNYAATKPFNEVAQLIASVQQDVKPIKEEVMIPVQNTPIVEE